MGLFSNEVKLFCNDCQRWFTVTVKSFLGLSLGNAVVDGERCTVITEPCPYCNRLKNWRIS